MLHFDGPWRFDTLGPIPRGVVDAFDELIGRIVAQGENRNLVWRAGDHSIR